jgi:hypothetical protein
MGEESTGDDVGSLAGDELVGDADRVAGAGAVVAGDHFKLPAQDAALAVDLLDRELPPFFVGIEKRGLRLVAVELTDLHRVLREGRRAETDGARGGEPKEPESGAHAVLHVTRFPLIHVRTSSEPDGKLVKVA